jgi:excisionase family DNA binding protein
MDTQVRVETANRHLLGRVQAAGYLNITTRTLDRLIARGLLRPIRLPGVRRTLFDRADLDALVDAGRESAE